MASKRNGSFSSSARRAQLAKRKRWEERWRSKQGREFFWYLDREPPELVQLIEGGSIPDGAALDVGCGPGVNTAYLARYFSPAVGLDVATGAVAQARDLASQREVVASFVVAEAPRLPFHPATFALVFDRGCLQNMPKDLWPAYFQEVERLLKPGGVLQLFCSKPLKRFPPLNSYRGVRARLRWMAGRAGPQFLSHEFLRSLAPPSVEVVSLEDFSWEPAGGRPRRMTVGLFRRI